MQIMEGPVGDSQYNTERKVPQNSEGVIYRLGTKTWKSLRWECSSGVGEELGRRMIASFLTPEFLMHSE